MKALILAAALVSVAYGQTTCNDVQFQACSAGLATAIGVSNIGLFNDYHILQNTFQNLFTQTPGDITNLVLVCNSLHRFYLCLGVTNAQLCLGVNGLIGKGRNPTQAYSIDGLLNSYQFLCGAGFYTAQYNNLACLQRVTLNFNDTLRSCLYTYNTNVLHDPANGCTYATQELNCYQAPFRQQCAPDQNVAGWWSCEGQRNWVRVRFPTCSALQCSLTPSNKDAEYLLDHHKEENGVHMFKMPDIWEQDENSEWHLKDGKWMTG